MNIRETDSHTAGKDFQTLFSDQQHLSMPSVIRFGLRTWLPGARISVPPVAGVARIWVVLNGILACQVLRNNAKVLPREVLSADGTCTFYARNVSRSDSVSAVEIELKKSAGNAFYAFDHRYFSDDQKDNKLCRFSALSRQSNTAPPRTTAEIYFSDLNQYESVFLENDNAMAAIVLRGSATLNGTALEPLQKSYVSDKSPMVVTGVNRCETLLIRELGRAVA